MARVAVIDGGGRGHTLVNKYLESSHVTGVLAIPGNDMMKAGREDRVETFPTLKTTSVKEIVEICRDRKIDLVDVAQDNAIEAGLADRLREAGVPTIGPSRDAGEIEWSKSFARVVEKNSTMKIPRFVTFHSPEYALTYLEHTSEGAFFVKADGLCEGKGALAARTKAEAAERIAELKKFGKAGETFLLEQWLKNYDGTNGEEFSSFSISDGSTSLHLGFAQDHKTVYDNDQGPNTGGMGCSSNPLVLNSIGLSQGAKAGTNGMPRILAEMGRPYQGVIYRSGMIITEKAGGKPVIYNIEWNSRWGDPEVQVIAPGIKSDFFEMGIAVVEQTLGSYELKVDGKTRVAVAGASRGYPIDYSDVNGKRIYGLKEAAFVEGVTVYGAGVKMEDGKYYANGGRLFYIVGEGKDINAARSRAYTAIQMIHIEGEGPEPNLHYRRDIGWRDVARLRQ